MIQFKLNDQDVADGTVLVISVQYPGSNSGRAYDYAAMKAGGRWYVTGTGKTPQDAGWGAVARWLTEQGRVVTRVRVATRLEPLWEATPDEVSR
jgi:hypothetical protein